MAGDEKEKAAATPVERLTTEERKAADAAEAERKRLEEHELLVQRLRYGPIRPE